MNLALPALIIILLILPGILLSYSYRRGYALRSPIAIGPIQHEIIIGLFLALIIQLILLPLANVVSGFEVDFQALLISLAGWPPINEVHIRHYIEASTSHTYLILIYLTASNMLALIVGILLHWVVRKNKLDLRYDFLRFNNEWYYLFTGEARIFEQPQKDRSIQGIKEFLKTEIDFIYISALVEQSNTSYLYWGALSDFYFDRSGKLDRIVLSNAYRRILEEDRNEDDSTSDLTDEGRFYKIAGDYFIIPYHEIININIEYFVLDETNSENA